MSTLSEERLGAEQYERHRQVVRARQLRQRAHASDLGVIPPCENPNERAAAGDDFEHFCNRYFPDQFSLTWSPAHHRLAEKGRMAIEQGGKFAFALPRGSGKTTFCQALVLWAILYGKSRYVVFIGATESKAESRLKAIKTVLQANDLLYDDFPEVCLPIRALERSNRRAPMQKSEGRSTGIEYLTKRLVMPTIYVEDEPVASSGSVIDVCGLTGDIRGAVHVTETGESIRPDLVICDDPQTRESAKSKVQSETRAQTIAGDVAYLAGPDRPTTVLLPCTVIYRDDLADQILDRERFPEWRGEREKMLLQWPTNEELWNEYDLIRQHSLQTYGDYREATEFYQERRDELDAGAEVYWPERYFDHEASAVQHAMNKYFEDEDSFFAEYQNEPKDTALGDNEILSRKEIAEKQTAMPRLLVPPEATKLISYIDVQKRLLYYVTTAFADDMTSWIVDYGTYPDQGRNYYSYSQAKPVLADVCKALRMEGRIYEGLSNLVGELLQQAYPRDDGAQQFHDLIMIDANWGESTDTIYQFCRQHANRQQLLPSHGKFVGASNPPLTAHKAKPGEKQRLHCLTALGDRRYKHAVYDTNYWKSFFHSRLSTPLGEPGCLTLFQGKHRLFADHCLSEYPVKTEGRGRKVHEWKHRPSEPDNHLFDCAVGCFVGANLQGANLRESNLAHQNRQRLKLSEIQAEKRKARS